MKVNMNAMATVTLTQRGAEIHNDFEHGPFSSAASLSSGATLRVPLWELFQIFGDRIYHGMLQGPFENNEIKLEEMQ